MTDRLHFHFIMGPGRVWGQKGTLGKEAGKFGMGYLTTLLDRALCVRHRGRPGKLSRGNGV